MSRNVRTTVKDSALVQERRNLIKERAISLFLRKGYHETTTRELAEACGMSAGSLYQYIGSKEDILHFIAEGSRRDAEALERRLDQSDDDDVVAALRECIAERVRASDRTRLGNMFINRHMISFSEEDRRAMLADMEARILSVKRLLERGVESGVFRVRFPLWLAHEILLMAWNWGQRRWFLRRHFTLGEYTGACTESVLDLIMVDRADRHEALPTGGQEGTSAGQDVATS